MDALAVLDALVAQPGRHAVLRRELVKDLQRQGKTPASATRALQRRCADGSLTRVGAGIYAIGQSRIADIVPEVLPKLGYRILDTPALRNYSIRRSGTLALAHAPLLHAGLSRPAAGTGCRCERPRTHPSPEAA